MRRFPSSIAPTAWLLVLGLSLPGPSFPCSPAPYRLSVGPTPCSERAMATEVFLGRVVRSTSMPFHEPAELEVEARFKGPERSHVEIHLSQCGPTLHEGQRYLIYASESAGLLRLWKAVDVGTAAFERHLAFLEGGSGVALDGLTLRSLDTPVDGIELVLGFEEGSVLARRQDDGRLAFQQIVLESDRNGHFYAYDLPAGEISVRVSDPSGRLRFPDLRFTAQAGECLEVAAPALDARSD